MRGTDPEYGATRAVCTVRYSHKRMVLSLQSSSLRFRYALSGTEPAYGATSVCVRPQGFSQAV
eukprot:727293-Rhodomonas_salina.1